jgi:hypothetical protein
MANRPKTLAERFEAESQKPVPIEGFHPPQVVGEASRRRPEPKLQPLGKFQSMLMEASLKKTS